MTPEHVNAQKLEYACFAIVSFLHTQLQKRHINSMEFLSMADQLPVKPVEMKHYSI